MTSTTSDWKIFQGSYMPHNGIESLPEPPNWRQFRRRQESHSQADQAQVYWNNLQDKGPGSPRDEERGRTFRIRTDQAQIVDAVNAALYLRRPLLVTGHPGSGKTSLAYAVAYELRLGPVLLWPITARSTLRDDGLYRYDAIARLQEAQLVKQAQDTGNKDAIALDPYRNIGQYIRLGALGTAFLPTPHPRVLLIDEIDKSDINLPNDLLNLLEEGEFEIPELVRLVKRNQETGQAQTPTNVRTADDLEFPLQGGKVRCQSFPLIIMTSNGERDFPPAFLRRCLRVQMPKPTETDLQQIVRAHFENHPNGNIADEITNLIQEFAQKTNKEAADLATDQLLNMIYMLIHDADVDRLKPLILKTLTSADGID